MVAAASRDRQRLATLISEIAVWSYSRLARYIVLLVGRARKTRWGSCPAVHLLKLPNIRALLLYRIAWSVSLTEVIDVRYILLKRVSSPRGASNRRGGWKRVSWSGIRRESMELTYRWAMRRPTPSGADGRDGRGVSDSRWRHDTHCRFWPLPAAGRMLKLASTPAAGFALGSTPAN